MDLPNIPLNKDLTYIGYSTFRDKNTLFGIKRKDRRQHTYILGKSGTGKSVLMSNMMMQNIINGEGVCIVDPHGELVEGILQSIPPHRMKDVVYFNPADTEYHIGFNVLELVDPKYKNLVASGLMGIFTKIWANAWSARMEYILNNTILALLDTPGTTLLGIQRMLVDKDYRQKIISNLKDPVIKAFWIHEYESWQDKFRNEAIAPIQNKVGQFLSTAVIRNIVGQSKSTINIFDLMNEGKIFLVNVSKGRIGEDNSKLIGGMIITKIQLAAMERVRIPEEERKDFYLYVDEFQNFVTDSFASILSEARKYRLCLTVAHQYTAQLVTKESSAMRDSIFGNVGTMIVFRVGADDADFLEKEFAPEFTPEDIVNLPNYKIYLKLMIDGITSRPFSARTIAPLVKGGNKESEAEVIRTSRELYCRPREDVEEEINKWSGMSLGDENSKDAKNTNPTGEKFETICSNCGNLTSVPFKPEPGRAVYCKDCIAKIKAGEMKPLKVSADQLKKDETKYFKPLADLGIEFSSDGVSSADKPKVYNKSENPHLEKKEIPKFNNDKREVKPEKKEGIFSNIKKVWNNKQDSPKTNLPPKPKIDTNTPKLGLKEVLDKALQNKDITEIKNEKKEEIKEDLTNLSLKDLLKNREVKTPKVAEDRSAKNETMDLLKNAIFSAPVVEEKNPTRNISHSDAGGEEANTELPKVELKEEVTEIVIPEVKHFSKITEKVEDVIDEIKKENEVKDEPTNTQNIPNNVNTYGNIKVEAKGEEGPLHVFDLPNLKNQKEEIPKNPVVEEKVKEIPEDVLKQVLNKE
jgi:CxxC-x17-CxxC domain-containing protein